MRHESNGIIKACFARGRKDVVATDNDDVSVLLLTPAHPEKSSDVFFLAHTIVLLSLICDHDVIT